MRDSLFSPTREELAIEFERRRRESEEFLDKEIESSAEGDAAVGARPKLTRRDAVMKALAPCFVIGDGPQQG